MTNKMARQQVVDIITAARARGECPNLSGLDLSGLDLSEVDFTGTKLNGANLRYSNLRGANLTDAYLFRADLSCAILTDANLLRANLRHVNLTDASLLRANLRCADMRYANLTAVILRGADLRDLKLCGLFLDGLPSGNLFFIPTPEGWHLTIGCWSGTTTELREMIADDDGWPEAEGEEIAVRRPMLEAMASACEAYANANPYALEEVKYAAARWKENR